MKRLLLLSAAAVLAPFALAAPAHADANGLGCEVIGNTTFSIGAFSTTTCFPAGPDSSYVLDYATSVNAASYSWTVPSGVSVVAGCNATSPFCDLLYRSRPADRDITVTVQASGASPSSVTAEIPAVCGKFFC